MSDLERRTAWIHADEAKAREAIGVPLNDEAMAVLREERGKHREAVFTYRSRPLQSVNTKAWKSALKRTGIETCEMAVDPARPISTTERCGFGGCLFFTMMVRRRTLQGC